MSRNYLKLNEEKTEIVEIGPYLNHFQTVKLGNTDVAVVEKAKNLGFISHLRRFFLTERSLESHFQEVQHGITRSS